MKQESDVFELDLEDLQDQGLEYEEDSINWEGEEIDLELAAAPARRRIINEDDGYEEYDGIEADVELDIDEDDLDAEDAEETNLGTDFLDAFFTYAQELSGLNFKKKDKKKTVKFKCTSPKKIALIMQDFDGNNILDLAEKGLKFTYLARSSEELYRATLNTDRSELVVLVIGNILGLDIEGMREVYFGVLNPEILDYRQANALGLSSKDCKFEEVLYVSRYFMSHILGLTIDWSTEVIDEELEDEEQEFNLGYYEKEDNDEEDEEYELEL